MPQIAVKGTGIFADGSLRNAGERSLLERAAEGGGSPAMGLWRVAGGINPFRHGWNEG